jgi:hypothetical protein
MFVMGVGSLNHCDPAKVAPHCSEVSTFALVTMHKGNEVPEKLAPLITVTVLTYIKGISAGGRPMSSMPPEPAVVEDVRPHHSTDCILHSYIQL